MKDELTNTDQLDEYELAFEAAALADVDGTPSGEPEKVETPTPPVTSDEPTDVPEKVEPAPAPAQADPPPVVPEPAKAQEPAQAPKPAEIEPEPLKVVEPPKGYEFTEEEKAAFAAAGELYPEVIPLFELLEKKIIETRNATRLFDMNQAIEQIQQRLNPLFSEAQYSARTRWESDVLSKHPDAFTLLPKVEEWVAKQPAILQGAYNQILDGGTSQQTVELLSLVKASPEFTPAQPAAAPSPEIEKKLESQEGIRSRSTVNRGDVVDPNDFDGAFDRFAANGN